MQGIDDLLVRVSRQGDADSHAYVVEMWLEGGRRVNAQEGLQLDDYVEPHPGDAASLTTHGLDLFNRLFSGRLGAAFQQAWAAAVARDRILRVRLALDPAAPAIHAVPWELLHFDDSGGMSPPRPLATDGRITFSRYIESADFAEGVQVSRRPLRLLLVIADPIDLQARWGLEPVGRASEERDFHSRFSPIVSSGQVRYDLLPVASAEALHDAIGRGGLDAEQPDGYDVVLFMGHAAHNAQHGSRLLLEDPQTRLARLYPADDLIGLMQQLPERRRPAMLVLVACNSARAARSQAINSMAARLVIDGGVPAVLAMQRLVEASLARRFTYHLSEHLLREGLIDVAVNAARRRVYRPDDIGWSTPTLYMRYADGRLFTPNAQLEYVEAILANPDYVRWSGPDFIDVGVLAVAPGQNWGLLRARPEDAPASVSAIESLHRLLDQSRPGARPERITAPTRSAGNITALIGPPHSGQTTILQRLAYDLAIKVTSDPSSPPGIMISLIGYETQRGVSRLERHIVEQARAANAALGEALGALFRPTAVPRADQQRPRYTFLLDNLDSLPARARRDLADELGALAERLIDQQFVLTSSQVNYTNLALRQAHVLVIQPLSEQQIMQHIRKREPRGAYRIFRQIRENRLLALASDPSLLTMIYSRVVGDPQARLTRNQIVQEYLDDALGAITPRYTIGDAARESLGALAWYSRWNHLDQISLGDTFRILADVRRDRDYSLEDLYRALCDTRVLVAVGPGASRFVNPAVHAYCAAVALAARADRDERFRDIISLCSSQKRQVWWEDVIYSLAGLVSDPAPIFEHLAAAIRGGSYTHALIAARALEALPPRQDSQLPAALRDELLDACVLRLRAEREPSADRREQIVTALGRLSYPQVRHELRRILLDRVRQTSSGPRYEYTNVRIAAARALRNIYLPGDTPFQRSPEPQGAQDLLLIRGGSDTTSLADQASDQQAPMPSIADIRNDQMLVRLMRAWEHGTEGRGEFLDILRNSPNPPERALAAFALGDLVDDGKKLLDARQLLRIILSPIDTAAERISPDWEDTMWAAADALTLFEPDQVAPLLSVLVQRKRSIPNSAAQQLAYLAGRLRASSPVILAWLIKLLITNPSQTIKSKALQSLAWMGMGIEQQRLELGDGRPGPPLKQIIQDIAAGREIRQLKLGAFNVARRSSDVDGTPTYLRRKAIEALAWVGDAETLRDLGGEVIRWPLELREHWYLAAATIRERLAGDAA